MKIAINSEFRKKMIFDFVARKKFYKEELQLGELIEHNGGLYMAAGNGSDSLVACLPVNIQNPSKKTLASIRNADFPENAVTVVGKIKKKNSKIKNILRLSEIRKSSDDVDFGRDRNRETRNNHFQKRT